MDYISTDFGANSLSRLSFYSTDRQTDTHTQRHRDADKSQTQLITHSHTRRRPDHAGVCVDRTELMDCLSMRRRRMMSLHACDVSCRRAIDDAVREPDTRAERRRLARPRLRLPRRQLQSLRLPGLMAQDAGR